MMKYVYIFNIIVNASYYSPKYKFDKKIKQQNWKYSLISLNLSAYMKIVFISKHNQLI